MGGISFEQPLGSRTEQLIDACTNYSKCVEVCPSMVPAGISGVRPEAVNGAVLDILRTSDGHAHCRIWASSCLLSGECITACDYGVNPRILLAMAHVAMIRTLMTEAETDTGPFMTPVLRFLREQLESLKPQLRQLNFVGAHYAATFWQQ